MSDEDTALEAAIDRVGRGRVFTRARQVGWKSGAPRWVWWMIIAELTPPPVLPQGWADWFAIGDLIL